MMRITLTVTAGPDKGRVFTFSGHDTFIVGRSKRAHFCFTGEDRYFSRVHFMVEANPPDCRIMDMGSRNGTHVNRKRVSVADLRNGDEIQAGRTILRVALENIETPAEPAPPPPPPPNSGANAEVQATKITLAEVNECATPEPLPQTLAFSRLGARTCPSCGAAIPIASIVARSAPTVEAVLCDACQQKTKDQPQQFPGFQILREIGRGGMGVVYLAKDTSNGKLVALKTIKPAVSGTEAQVARFLREANILRELQHPHIVSFRAMGEADQQLYFAMDYVEGTDAARLLKSHDGFLPIGRAVGLACQLLDALTHAHAKGFVHRDLKPANLLVTDVEGKEFVKLADFGLARVYQTSQLSGLSIMGDIAGTVAFMPPEQITHFRDAKPHTDQYAAAATLYNLLTKSYVFNLSGTVQEHLLSILQDDPVPIQSRRTDIPDQVAGIIHRALSREPEDRFADVQAMRHALVKACC